jgi:hypothetical protein
MQTIAFFNMFSMLMTLIFEYHYIYHNFEDVDNITDTIMYNVATSYTLLKLLVFYLHKQRFDCIIQKLRIMFREGW